MNKRKQSTETRADSPASRRFCSKPFDKLVLDPNGEGWVCCSDWLSTSIGSAHGQSIRALWNSPTAQNIRASILDGSFRYCNEALCPELVKDTLPTQAEVTQRRHQRVIESGQTELDTGPSILSLGYDNTCNLKCPSCRADFIVLQGDELTRAEQIQRQLLSEGLRDAHSLVITGTGDAFASRLYRKLLQTMSREDYPALSIFLMTNGLLFTPQMWQSMHKLHGTISGVSISIDAATPETYAVNRGGSFDKLMRNLEFIGNLVRDGAMKWYEISFVVQQNNYREMVPFARMGKRFGCTSVLFQRIVFWEGTMSEDEFRRLAIHEEGHPEHASLLRELASPELEDAIVDLSNLNELRSPARSGASAVGGAK